MTDAAAATDRQLQILGDLAELGLQAARAVARDAEAGAAPASETALAYARVSRAVRLAILLQTEIAKAQAEASAEDDGIDERLAPDYVRKVRVERIVERLAEAEHPDDAHAVDGLVKDAAERLDDDDLYGDLLDRPLSELVARICRDIGLKPDWVQLAEEHWARAEAASGEPGWPLRPSPLPLDGGEVGSGGDGPAEVRPTGRPHPQPFPHQGGSEPLFSP